MMMGQGLTDQQFADMEVLKPVTVDDGPENPLGPVAAVHR